MKNANLARRVQSLAHKHVLFASPVIMQPGIAHQDVLNAHAVIIKTVFHKFYVCNVMSVNLLRERAVLPVHLVPSANMRIALPLKNVYPAPLAVQAIPMVKLYVVSVNQAIILPTFPAPHVRAVNLVQLSPPRVQVTAKNAQWVTTNYILVR